MSEINLLRGLYGLSGRLTFRSFVVILLCDFGFFLVMAFTAVAIRSEEKPGHAHAVSLTLLLIAVAVLAWAILSLAVRVVNSIRFYLWNKRRGQLSESGLQTGDIAAETQESDKRFQARCRQMTSGMKVVVTAQYIQELRKNGRICADLPAIMLGANPVKIVLINAVFLVGFLFGLANITHIFPHADTGGGFLCVLLSLICAMLGLNLFRMRLFLLTDGFGVRSYVFTKFYRWSDIDGTFEFESGRRGGAYKGDDFVGFTTKPISNGGKWVQQPERHTIEGSFKMPANDLAELMNIYLARACARQ